MWRYGYWHPWAWGWPRWWLSPFVWAWGPPSKEDEAAMLEEQARMLEDELARIKERLEELKK